MSLSAKRPTAFRKRIAIRTAHTVATIVQLRTGLPFCSGGRIAAAASEHTEPQVAIHPHADERDRHEQADVERVRLPADHQPGGRRDRERGHGEEMDAEKIRWGEFVDEAARRGLRRVVPDHFEQANVVRIREGRQYATGRDQHGGSPIRSSGIDAPEAQHDPAEHELNVDVRPEREEREQRDGRARRSGLAGGQDGPQREGGERDRDMPGPFGRHGRERDRDRQRDRERDDSIAESDEKKREDGCGGQRDEAGPEKKDAELAAGDEAAVQQPFVEPTVRLPGKFLFDADARDRIAVGHRAGSVDELADAEVPSGIGIERGPQRVRPGEGSERGDREENDSVRTGGHGA